MSETLDIRTRWTDVADAVEELANHVDDTSVRVPCERPIADGEWVRFAVQLADGTAVLEGVGRAQGKTNGRLLLSLLQFDERNEIMYERVLLARDGGEVTGQQPIVERAAERDVAPPLPVFEPPAAKPSIPRPPAPKRPPATPAPGAPAARGAPAAMAQAAPSRPPPAPLPPRPTPKPASQAAAPSTAPRRRRKPLKVPVDPAADTAKEMATHDTVISAPSALVPIPSDPDALRIEVPRSLVSRARALAPTLPRAVVDPERARRSPEEAVLQAALRLGLASLAALADVDDDL
ncbi:MAG: hypothetical protein RID81_13590 [Sandaracinaceae bacterium]